MTMFLLVRHASSEWIHERYIGRAIDSALTEAGAAQARTLAEHIAAEHIDYIHSSPRLRTRETARAIAERRNVEVETHAALDEIDVGEWAGRSFAELEGDPRWELWNRARHLQTTPGGEDMLDVQHRIVRHLRLTRQRYPDRIVLIVTHAEVVRCALLYYLGLPLSAHQTIEVQPAALSRLQVDDHVGRVVALNEYAAVMP